ncbi:MAG: hypothetical protein IJE97_07140 [Thermoguttaceae bacterium]|nr:hypothetical protein [Thermoguttaceae bacterium]
MSTIFSDNANPNSEKFEKLFAKFKADYANCAEQDKLAVVNALLADVAVELQNYIHRRNRPSDVTTGTVLSRTYLSVSKYFTDGAGDPERYETGRQFILLLKRVVSQSICARIRQYVQEHGGDDAEVVSIGGGQADNDAPSFQLQASGDFAKDVEQQELVDVLCRHLATAERGESPRISAKDQKLLELRFQEEYTLTEIAEYFDTNVTAVRRRLAAVLEKLRCMFNDLGVDSL